MGYIQDKIESDRKISEAFQAVASDPEIHEAVMKAIQAQCPLCNGSCDSPNIRICEDHKIELLTK
jgi:hypothetical protein